MKKIAKSLRNKSVKELRQSEESLRKEIARIRLEQKVNPQKDTNVLMKKRKELAVLLTVLGEKQEVEKLSKEQ